MEQNTLNQLKEKRRAIRHLLSATDPGDALASYYALWHDPRRTRLTLHHGPDQRADGFLVVAQTGADLFRPLVTLRAPTPQVAADLLRAALGPNRPYQVIVPVARAPLVRQALQVDRARLAHLYRLDPARFQPIVNVLVQRLDSPDGVPRFQIESRGQLMAMAGTNWRSPTFAEVYVYVHPGGRGRGWGKSVVSACTAALLKERLRPLYLTEEENEASLQIAQGLGYVDTGQRTFIAQAHLP